jgi:hypothetical protein
MEGLRQAVDSQTGTLGDARPLSIPKEDGACSIHFIGADAIAVGR